MQKLSREDLLNKLKGFFNAKAAEYEVDLAFLYGSWARGYPRVDSDVDLAVIFSNKLSSENQIFYILNELCVAIAEEIRKEVNVLPIFPDFRKPMLYYNAMVLGKPVYIRSTEKYAQFFVEAINQMEDFSIFGTKWQLCAASKNLEEVKHG